MKVTFLLADAAEVVGGKLYILGGGWSVQRGGGPFSIALALKIEVPWNETNRQHHIVGELLDQDGQPATPIGAPQPLRFEGQMEAGRPPGLPAGTAIDTPLAVTMHGIQLAPGGYRWQFKIDDTVEAESSFLVMPPQQPGGQQ